MIRFHNKYTYQLAKRGKWICPNCGRKTFVCYVDAEGNVLNEQVGKCDRADHCAYHYPPRLYFHDNRSMSNYHSYYLPPRPKVRRLPQPTYIDSETIFKPSVDGTLTHRNNLIEFLKTVFDEKRVKQMIQDYYIGTSKHFGGGAAVFYQVSQYGKVHRGKVMQYDAGNGKRVKKNGSGLVTSVHKLMNLGDDLPSQCLFGEHLLKEHRDMYVGIVESEKTAIIASAMFDDCLMLASGGCGNLSPSLCEPLRGRNVYLFPDNGKYHEWKEKGRRMRHLFGELSITDIMEREAQEPGEDIGDLYLRKYPNIDEIVFDFKDV